MTLAGLRLLARGVQLIDLWERDRGAERDGRVKDRAEDVKVPLQATALAWLALDDHVEQGPRCARLLELLHRWHRQADGET